VLPQEIIKLKGMPRAVPNPGLRVSVKTLAWECQSSMETFVCYYPYMST